TDREALTRIRPIVRLGLRALLHTDLLLSFSAHSAPSPGSVAAEGVTADGCAAIGRKERLRPSLSSSKFSAHDSSHPAFSPQSPWFSPYRTPSECDFVRSLPPPLCAVISRSSGLQRSGQNQDRKDDPEHHEQDREHGFWLQESGVRRTRCET